jgi:hypothetical protein
MPTSTKSKEETTNFNTHTQQKKVFDEVVLAHQASHKQNIIDSQICHKTTFNIYTQPMDGIETIPFHHTNHCYVM